MAGDKFMPELHLKQPKFTYSVCGPSTKHLEIVNIRETVNLQQLYRNELGKACFSHDASYSNCKHLAKRTISDKILGDEAYEITRNCKYDGHQRALASMIHKFFDKRTGLGVSVNEQLAEELHKPVKQNSKEEKSMRDLKTIFGQQV